MSQPFSSFWPPNIGALFHDGHLSCVSHLQSSPHLAAGGSVSSLPTLLDCPSCRIKLLALAVGGIALVAILKTLCRRRSPHKEEEAVPEQKCVRCHTNPGTWEQSATLYVSEAADSKQSPDEGGGAKVAGYNRGGHDAPLPPICLSETDSEEFLNIEHRLVRKEQERARLLEKITKGREKERKLKDAANGKGLEEFREYVTRATAEVNSRKENHLKRQAEKQDQIRQHKETIQKLREKLRQLSVTEAATTPAVHQDSHPNDNLNQDVLLQSPVIATAGADGAPEQAPPETSKKETADIQTDVQVDVPTVEPLLANDSTPDQPLIRPLVLPEQSVSPVESIRTIVHEFHGGQDSLHPTNDFCWELQQKTLEFQHRQLQQELQNLKKTLEQSVIRFILPRRSFRTVDDALGRLQRISTHLDTLDQVKTPSGVLAKTEQDRQGEQAKTAIQGRWTGRGTTDIIQRSKYASDCNSERTQQPVRQRLHRRHHATSTGGKPKPNSAHSNYSPPVSVRYQRTRYPPRRLTSESESASRLFVSTPRSLRRQHRSSPQKGRNFSSTEEEIPFLSSSSSSSHSESVATLTPPPSRCILSAAAVLEKSLRPPINNRHIPPRPIRTPRQTFRSTKNTSTHSRPQLSFPLSTQSRSRRPKDKPVITFL